MRTASAVLLVVIGSVSGLGCGSNGATGPVVSISPATLTVHTGDGATTFAAVLSNGAVDPVTWALAGPGSISATTGDQTSYTPPALGASGGTATLRATADCGAGCAPVGFTATITVDTATTGTLTITVTTPNLMSASLTVSGPNSYTQSINTPTGTTLTGLAAGTYTVTAQPITINDPIVTSEYTAPTVQAAVTANAAAAAAITYAAPPGSGLLWTVGTADTLEGWSSANLRANTFPDVSPGTSSSVQGIAFDASGNMFASLAGPPGSVVSYAPAGLANSDPLTPSVTFNDSNINNPSGVALGPDGRLWVANCGNNRIAVYPLAGGPADFVITSPSLFNCPNGIAFDSSGALWVANANGVVERFQNAEVEAGNSMPVADVTLTPPSNPASSQPYGIALDTEGNVWVSFFVGSTVARYNVVGFPGTTTPAAVLSPTDAGPESLDHPVALAIDNSGLLWVANAGQTQALSQFAAADMDAGGAAAPITVVQGIGVTLGGLAFNPSPANLPINH